MVRISAARLCVVSALVLASYGCDSGSSEGGGQGGEGGMSMGDMGSGGSGGSDMGSGDVDQGELIMRCATDDMCPEDKYCRIGEGQTLSLCAYGCREGNCADGQLCEAERRICIRDTSCTADEDCFGGEYCADGQCAEGCRVGNADDCPRNEMAEPRTCDPATHECVVQVVCCDALDQCTLELPDECSSPLLGERGCFNPNPCALRCMADGDCEVGTYCGDENRCVEGCRTSGQSGCRDDRICEAETRECIRPPCAVDTDCEDDFFCDGQACLPGCRQEPDSCRRGEFCDERRRCVPDDAPRDCVDDAECVEANGAGWFCDGTDCQPPCGSHDECVDGEACIEGRCAEGCRDDEFEPNDDRNRARGLNFEDNRYNSGDTSLFACSRNPDWYTFETPAAGMTIEVNLIFTHANGNLDMRIYGPDGELIETSNTRDDNESIRLTSQADDQLPQGRFWIEIYGRGFDENTYSFSANLLRGLGPDAAEPDNDRMTATVVSMPDLQESRTISDRTIHPNDEDWFAIQMGQRDGLSVRLDMLGNDSGRDAEFSFLLFGPGLQEAGQAPLAIGEGDNGVPYVEFVVPRFNFTIQDGTYYVRVAGLNGDQVGRYRLALSVDRDSILCVADSAEPNDEANTAHSLMDRDGFVFVGFDGQRELIPAEDLRLPGLNLCNDDDWFEITLRENDALEVRLERREVALMGDTQIQIYNAVGNEIAAGLSGERVNVARIEQANAGTYRVRLSSIGMTRTTYELVLFRTAGPIACAPDRYDSAAPNEQRDQASVIPGGTHRDLALCGADNDEDWYRFEVDGLSTITTSLFFAHAQGDLNLDVYFEADVEAINAGDRAGHSDSDDEVVTLENRQPGTYYVRVQAVGAANVRYTLEVNIEETVLICPDDGDEPNNTFDEATSLGNGLVDRETQWICERRPADDDTFHMVVPAGASRSLAATFLFGDDGDLFLQLFDADGMALLSTADIQRGNSKQCIVIPSSNIARGFYVRVVPLAINRIQQDDERLDYRLRLQAGEDCDAIPPETPGVDWPRLGE